MSRSKGKVKYSKNNLIRLGNRIIIVSVAGSIVTVPLAVGFGLGYNAGLNEKEKANVPEIPPAQVMELDDDFVTSSDVNPIVENTLSQTQNIAQVDFDVEPNDFLHDHLYKDGDTINVEEECDFSRISVVLNSGDMSLDTQTTLEQTKEDLDKLGIDSVVVDYYSDPVEVAKEKEDMGQNVFAITLEKGKNDNNGTLVATEYKTGLTENRQKQTSSDVLATAIHYGIAGSYIKSGIASPIEENERVATTTEDNAREKRSYLKCVTIRPSSLDPLPSSMIVNAITNGIVKASTCNNNKEFIDPNGNFVEEVPISLTNAISIDKGRVSRL